jgi:hypothetical protein
MNERPPPRKRGIGCLPSLILLLLLGPIVVMAIDLAFAPWIYIVGGRTRLLPVWAGTGVVHTPSGPYSIYVWFSPARAGSHVVASTSINGSGYVCTPPGQRYSLRVTGGASGKIWNNMDGHTFHISANHRPVFWQFKQDWRPWLSFSGQWVGPNLVMSDDASITHAFQPDGTLKPDDGRWHPKTGALPITLTETHWSLGGIDCPRPRSQQ